MRAGTNVTPFSVSRDSAAKSRPAFDAFWKVYLAGTMQVIGPDGESALPTARKARGLIAYLALATNRRATRTRLATLLWNKSDDLTRHSLRQVLHEFERLKQPGAPALIQLERDYVSLDQENCWIDVIAEPDQHVERLLDDLDGLSDGFDRWLSDERTRFEDQVRNVLSAELAQLESENAPADRRTVAARRLVGFDPTHEGGVRALMKALADQGNHVQALREYQRCRDELRKALDVPPSRETVALHEAIRLVSSRDASHFKRPVKAEITTLAASGFSTERPGGPSIAVLPFANLSDEQRHGNASAALAEDLISTLSRVPGFFVTSRQTTRSFHGQAHRLPQDIGDMLDVRYLLSGSLRLAGERLHLNAELTDTIRGGVLWSEGIEERFADLFDVPMRLAEEIVRRAAPHLRQAELTRARTKRPEHLTAYDFLIQAQDDMHNFSRSVFDRAERLFDRALELAPTYSAALAWKAYWHVLRVGQGWSPDKALDTKLATEFANRALDCDPREPMALGIQGHIASYLHKDFDLAFDRFEDALQLNPNAAPVWVWSGIARAWNGQGNRAVAEATRGRALSPFDPLNYFFNSCTGMAYLIDGQLERAIECGYLCLQENRRYSAGHRLLVLGLMLAGRADEARSAAHRMMTIEPGMTIEAFRTRYPGADHPHVELYCDALAEAGVPPR